MHGLEEGDVAGVMDGGDRVGAVERRFDDLVALLPDDVEKDPVALGAVGLLDEFSGAKDLFRIMQGLIRMVDDAHHLVPLGLWTAHARRGAQSSERPRVSGVRTIWVASVMAQTSIT